MAATRRSILVIDDQEDERTIQRTMLSHLGYEVREAADGQAGMEMVQQEAPDLILLDIAIPRVDGFAFCRALRAAPHTAGIPVLFFTAASVEDLEARVREAGGAGLLVKPVDPHQVAEAVHGLIGPPAP